MKRPHNTDEFVYEFPGYWALRLNGKTLTVGDCGIQIHNEDMSENLAALGSDTNPLDVTIVELYNTLEQFNFADYFLSVVWLSIRSRTEIKLRGLV